jgi:hypothetical protein
LTIVNRLWSRLDIRSLVEDHGDGRCLCRLRMRSRVTAAHFPFVLGIATVMVLHATGLMAWPLAATVVSLLAGVIGVGDIVVTSSVVSNIVDSVAAELGMLPIGSAERVRGEPTHVAELSGFLPLGHAPGRGADIAKRHPLEESAAVHVATEDTPVSRALAGKV